MTCSTFFSPQTQAQAAPKVHFRVCRACTGTHAKPDLRVNPYGSHSPPVRWIVTSTTPSISKTSIGEDAKPKTPASFSPPKTTLLLPSVATALLLSPPAPTQARCDSMIMRIARSVGNHDVDSVATTTFLPSPSAQCSPLLHQGQACLPSCPRSSN